MVPESKGRRELGSSGLTRTELSDSRLRSEFGGSGLRRKEHRLSRPGMKKLGCSRLCCETELCDLRLGWRALVDFRQTKIDGA